MNSLSFSHYSTLRQCGRKYKLSVIDKIPQPNQVHFEFGTALHAGLNTSLETKDPETAIAVFEEYWSQTKKKELQYERHSHTDLLNVGVKFVANFTKKYAKDMKLIVAEKRLYADYDPELTLEGTPDALVEIDGRNVLLDFKSSAYNYDNVKTNISLQLHLYAHLLVKNGYRVDDISYQVFNKSAGTLQTPFKIPYVESVANGMIYEMVAYYKRNKDGFERNPGACVMGKMHCPYISRCFQLTNKDAEV